MKLLSTTSYLLFMITGMGLLHFPPLQGKEKQKSAQSEPKTQAMTAQQLSDEEAFLLRRIAEFYKDGDYNQVKKQAETFLENYPRSERKSYLQGLVADTYLKEKEYEKALSFYQKIEDIVVMQSTMINKLQCYYELDQLDTLIKEAQEFIKNPLETISIRKEELFFLLAEALFRTATEKPLEERKSLAKQAKTYYEKIKNSQYATPKKFALAEIALILEDYEIAAKAFHELATKHSDKKEELFFRAAVAEAKIDPSKAITTFSTIYSLGGAKAGEALFNSLILLFEQEKYEQVINQVDQATAKVPENLQPTLQFVLGKSYFSLHEYGKAIKPLGTYIASQVEPCDELKNALLIQMTCASHLCDEALFAASFSRLKTLFPTDSEIPNALFMHAMMLKKEGKLELAEENLKEIATSYPCFEHNEAFLFELGFLHYETKHWQASYEILRKYLSAFKTGEYIEDAWKLFLCACFDRYKANLQNNTLEKYPTKTFFEDLQQILDQKDIFTLSEWIDYTLVYAKVAYELEEFNAALLALQDSIFTESNQVVSNAHLADAHFIAALCHSQLQPDYSAFCMHLEKALELNPTLYETDATHIQLYNAYISLAGFGAAESELSGSTAQQNECIHQASEHLYEVISRKKAPVKEENILWLASHYYAKAQAHFSQIAAYKLPLPTDVFTAVERAFEQYDLLLFQDNRLITITSEKAHLEVECLKFAKCLEYQGNYEKQLAVLHGLIEQQTHSKSVSWQAKQETLIEFGLACLHLGKKEQALETFSFIDQKSSALMTTSLKNKAALEASRLEFSLLPSPLKMASNPQVQSILTRLKDLQILKSGVDFPTHIEAAIEYAQIRACLASDGEKISCYRHFLKRLEEDFHPNSSDPMTQEYLKQIEQTAEKSQAFAAYLQFFRAEHLRLNAKESRVEEKMREMEELNEKALALYNEIKTNPCTPQPLFKRTCQSIALIHATNAYD